MGRQEGKREAGLGKRTMGERYGRKSRGRRRVGLGMVRAEQR